MKDHESVKTSKKKGKKEDAWRSDGPKDPVAMVGVSEPQSVLSKQYASNALVTAVLVGFGPRTTVQLSQPTGSGLKTPDRLRIPFSMKNN